MPSPRYDASSLSLPLECICLTGHDPHLLVLFRVLGRHPLHDASLASGSTYVFICDTSARGRQRDAEYYESLQVPSGLLQDIDTSGHLCLQPGDMVFARSRDCTDQTGLSDLFQIFVMDK